MPNQALTEKETHEYLEHRLKVAGYKGPQLFANKATKTIWAYSEGIPRTINIICDNALLTGYSKNTKRIDSSIVQEVINDLDNVRLNNVEPQKEERRGPTEVQGKRKKRRVSPAWTAAIAAVVIITIGIMYVFMGNVSDFSNELSLKSESVKDRIQNQSEGRNSASDKAQKDMLQRPNTPDENKMDSREHTSAANPILQPAVDRSQSESRVDDGKTGDEDSVVVQKGETLEEIMMRVYRKKDTKILDAILKINPEIKNRNLIYENQIIRLPGKADQD